MPEPQVLRFLPAVIDTVGPQLVWLKSRWQDDWQLVPELWCGEATWAVNPTLPTAQLEHRYGSGLRVPLTFFQFWPRINNKLRQYVRVDCLLNFINPDDESPLLRRWYGVLEIEIDELHGPMLGVEEGQPTAFGTGKNHWTAYGLESLLDTVDCTASIIQGESAEDEITVARAIPFNPRVPGTLKRRGNRSASADGDGVYRFHNRTSGGSDWSTRECVKYLLKHDAPKEYSGERALPFVLFDPEGIAPTWDDPELPRQDRTVRELLNALLARQRLLGYRVLVEEPSEGDPNAGGQQISIVPVSFAGEDLPLDPEGSTGDAVFKANPSQKILAIEQDRGATASLKRSAADQFDQVVARGAQRTSTATFSYVDSTLALGWTEDQETAFEAGASNEAGYPPPAEVAARAWANFRARGVDSLKRVYARHILPQDFPGYVGDGESGDAGYVLQPSDADSEAPTPIAPDDRRFLTELPLLVDHDYSGNKIADQASVEEGAAPHLHLQPLVLFRRIDWTDDAKRYRHAEKAADTLDLEVLGTAPDFGTARVHVDHQDGALWVEVSSGLQQAIAKTDFTPLPVDTLVVADAFGDFRFLLATLAVPWSQYAEARFPVELAPQGVDGIRRMTLLLGDDYRADYVAPQTVVGLTAGGELIRSDGGYLRDDRPKLAAIAKLAWQWYGKFRQALSFHTSLVNNALEVGDYLVSIGDPAIPGDIHDDVGSVVTQLRLAMPLAESEGQLSVAAPHMAYTTAFGELDALQLRRTL